MIAVFERLRINFSRANCHLTRIRNATFERCWKNLIYALSKNTSLSTKGSRWTVKTGIEWAEGDVTIKACRIADTALKNMFKLY